MLYISVIGAVAFSGAHFGQGSGPIHADDVQCTGSEGRLNNCPYDTTNTCSHSEDAGVRCEGINSVPGSAPRPWLK